MAAAADRPVTDADPLARVTAVIVNYNSGPWLERCLRTLRGGDGAEPAVVVVDNDSTDGSLEGLGPFPDVHLVRSSSNPGFAVGVNRGADGVATEYLLVLNPDCLLTPEGLRRLVTELDHHPECGLASGRVFDTAGSEQRGSRRALPTPERILGEVLPGRRPAVDLTDQPSPAEPAEVEAVSGACMLIRSRAFRAVDGFDTGYPMHFEDLDLMARLGVAGWTIRLDPGVIATHAGGISSARRPAAVAWAKHRGLWRYLRRHCRADIPAWQWPLWAAAIHGHGLARASLAWLRRR